MLRLWIGRMAAPKAGLQFENFASRVLQRFSSAKETREIRPVKRNGTVRERGRRKRGFSHQKVSRSTCFAWRYSERGSGKWQLLWITGRGGKIYRKTLEIRSTKLPGCGGKIQRFLDFADGTGVVGAVCFRFVKLHEREGNSGYCRDTVGWVHVLYRVAVESRKRRNGVLRGAAM